ncbi:hypothetical protein Thpro_020653 [Acidihalobacter prosperus]|uniref:Uncharacterized protein n=1 Tax=Acidihalobacter prosperus TaxID=160660 RepID=A0A1A6C8P2_9GAMM|nr:hypothetical protein Thpro_020653 [Acidihalobacter prosperus]
MPSLRTLAPLGLPALFLAGPLAGILLVATIFGLPPGLILLAGGVFALSLSSLLWLSLRRRRDHSHTRR